MIDVLPLRYDSASHRTAPLWQLRGDWRSGAVRCLILFYSTVLFTYQYQPSGSTRKEGMRMRISETVNPRQCSEPDRDSGHRIFGGGHVCVGAASVLYHVQRGEVSWNPRASLDDSKST